MIWSAVVTDAGPPVSVALTASSLSITSVSAVLVPAGAAPSAPVADTSSRIPPVPGAAVTRAAIVTSLDVPAFTVNGALSLKFTESSPDVPAPEDRSVTDRLSGPEVTEIVAFAGTVSPTFAFAGGSPEMVSVQSWRLFEPTVRLCSFAAVGLVPVVAGVNVTTALLFTACPSATELLTAAENVSTCESPAPSGSTGAVTLVASDVHAPQAAPSSLMPVGAFRLVSVSLSVADVSALPLFANVTETSTTSSSSSVPPSWSVIVCGPTTTTGASTVDIAGVTDDRAAGQRDVAHRVRDTGRRFGDRRAVGIGVVDADGQRVVGRRAGRERGGAVGSPDEGRAGRHGEPGLRHVDLRRGGVRVVGQAQRVRDLVGQVDVRRRAGQRGRHRLVDVDRVGQRGLHRSRWRRASRRSRSAAWPPPGRARP